MVQKRSLSNALYFAGFSLFEKNASGSQLSWFRCCNVAPIVDAFVNKANSAFVLGCVRREAWTKLSFEASNARRACGVRVTNAFPFMSPWRKSLKGAKILAAFGKPSIKPSIKVKHSEVSPLRFLVLDIRGSRARAAVESSLWIPISRKFYLGLTKYALRGIDEDPVFLQSFELFS